MFYDRRTVQEELESSRTQYQVKAEYKQDAPRRGSMNKVPVRNSYRRTVSEDVYSIPLGEGSARGLTVPYPVDQGYSQQTSMDTTYNVPSIRTEVSGPVQPRFDSIAEMEGEKDGRRNQGFLL